MSFTLECVSSHLYDRLGLSCLIHTCVISSSRTSTQSCLIFFYGNVLFTFTWHSLLPTACFFQSFLLISAHVLLHFIYSCLHFFLAGVLSSYQILYFLFIYLFFFLVVEPTCPRPPLLSRSLRQLSVFFKIFSCFFLYNLLIHTCMFTHFHRWLKRNSCMTRDFQDHSLLDFI